MTDRPPSGKNKSGSTATQFRKGHSGNPAGRPRKKHVAPAATSAFDKLLDRTLTIIEDDEPREVSIEEALARKIYADAIAGKSSAQRKLLKMIAERDAALASASPPVITSNVPPLLIYDSNTADDALLILGVASLDPHHSMTSDERGLLLEPWAVQAAIDRLPRTSFKAEDVATIKRHTRDHVFPKRLGKRSLHEP